MWQSGNHEDADHQLTLDIGGDPDTSPSMVKTTRRANKRRLPVLQPVLPIEDDGFVPVAGVPRTRAECPKERPCPRVMCEWHLWRVDAENRAGRPGLASVPRDEQGRTIAVDGDAGEARPGTTLRPLWLETERHCRAVIKLDQTGQVCAIDVVGDHLSTTANGNGDEAWGQMRLHEGEQLRVVAEDGTWATRAEWRSGAVVLKRAPLVTCAVLITRVRVTPSCGLDLIERHGKLTNQQIGDGIGRHRTLVAREVKAALRKLIEEGKRQGVEAMDLMRAIMGMEDA